MSITKNHDEMREESLLELIYVAKWCLNQSKIKHGFEKDGCFGYPSSILLMSIVDALGERVMEGGNDVPQHFKILNHEDYYNLNLTSEQLDKIYKNYRCKLTHNSIIPIGYALYNGLESEPSFIFNNDMVILNLNSFMKISKKSVDTYLSKIS